LASGFFEVVDHCGIETPQAYHNTLEKTAEMISNKRVTDRQASWYLAQKYWAKQLFNYSMFNLNMD
jgi:hypothetical protein